MSRIAEMSVWDDAKLEASENLRTARHRLVQLEQEHLVRSGSLTQLENKVGLNHHFINHFLVIQCM